MSPGYISECKPCPSEIKLKSSYAVTQPRMHFKSSELWATVTLLLISHPPPTQDTGMWTATQSASLVCWSSQKGLAFSVLPAGSVVLLGSCASAGLLCLPSSNLQAHCLQPVATPHPDTPSRLGPGNAVTQFTCFRAEEANVTGRVWLIKAPLTDETACFGFL